MRRFEVWIYSEALQTRITWFCEVADDASDEECEGACRDEIEELFASCPERGAKTGWRELKDEKQ